MPKSQSKSKNPGIDYVSVYIVYEIITHRHFNSKISKISKVTYFLKGRIGRIAISQFIKRENKEKREKKLVFQLKMQFYISLFQ